MIGLGQQTREECTRIPQLLRALERRLTHERIQSEERLNERISQLQQQLDQITLLLQATTHTQQ
jgi:CII-binding regulator of phage lambda lysogenization HflD